MKAFSIGLVACVVLMAVTALTLSALSESGVGGTSSSSVSVRL
jgi:hypothetical protein